MNNRKGGDWDISQSNIIMKISKKSFVILMSSFFVMGTYIGVHSADKALDNILYRKEVKTTSFLSKLVENQIPSLSSLQDANIINSKYTLIDFNLKEKSRDAIKKKIDSGECKGYTITDIKVDISRIQFDDKTKKIQSFVELTNKSGLQRFYVIVFDSSNYNIKSIVKM